jgi:hypothetical protein
MSAVPAAPIPEAQSHDTANRQRQLRGESMPQSLPSTPPGQIRNPAEPSASYSMI